MTCPRLALTIYIFVTLILMLWHRQTHISPRRNRQNNRGSSYSSVKNHRIMITLLLIWSIIAKLFVILSLFEGNQGLQHTRKVSIGNWWTTCPLHESLPFGSHFKMRVGMYVWTEISYIYYFLPRFTVSWMKLVIILFYMTFHITSTLYTHIH